MKDQDRWRAIGDDIADRRRERGWNQRKLGDLIGDISQGVVSDDERGKAQGIPPSRLIGYAHALTDTDQDADDLLELWLSVAYRGHQGVDQEVSRKPA